MKPKLLRTILVLIIILYGSDIKAQEAKPVSGIVTSFRNLPLNKAKVVSSKSGETVFTDASGQFTISINKNDVLKVTAFGFTERKIRTGKQTIYKIDLLYNDNVTNFNDAVIHEHVTEAALQQAISANQLKKGKDYSVYNSIYELISSELYDVRVKGTSVYNRKVRSFDSNPQVLYVVNDKVITDISYVNPTFVKSIEFIDDVGATMWGAQGANGVIKITLK